MANKRIDELPASASFDSTDLFEKERDPSGTKAHEKSTLQELVDFLAPQLGFKTYDTINDFEAASDYVDRGVFIVFGDATIDDGYTTTWRFSSTSMAALAPGVRKPDAINIADPGRYIQINP